MDYGCCWWWFGSVWFDLGVVCLFCFAFVMNFVVAKANRKVAGLRDPSTTAFLVVTGRCHHSLSWSYHMNVSEFVVTFYFCLFCFLLLFWVLPIGMRDSQKAGKALRYNPSSMIVPFKLHTHTHTSEHTDKSTETRSARYWDRHRRHPTWSHKWGSSFSCGGVYNREHSTHAYIQHSCRLRLWEPSTNRRCFLKIISEI